MARFKKGDRVVAMTDSRFIKRGMVGTVDQDNSTEPWVLWDAPVGTSDPRWARAESTLRPAGGTLETLQAGDVLVDHEKKEHEVFASLGNIIAIHDGYDDGCFDLEWHHIRYLQDRNWTIKQDTSAAPTVTELSVAELEEKLKLPSGSLRVKKD